MMQAAQHDSAALRGSSHSAMMQTVQRCAAALTAQGCVKTQAIMRGIESIIDQLSANN